MVENVNLAISFIAGILSFFSPCVVVIVPIFLANLAGVKFDQIEEKQLKKHIFYSTILFVLGFIFVFTLFGIVSGLFAKLFSQYINYFNVLAGILIILFGLVTLELIPLNLFQRTLKVNYTGSQGYNLVKSFLVGAAFAAGWTPCVGPILAAILLIAGSSGTAFVGGIYLFVYSLGFALPFLIFSLFISKISDWLKKVQHLLKYFNYLAGVFLILLGILLITNRLGELVSFFYFLYQPKF